MSADTRVMVAAVLAMTAWILVPAGVFSTGPVAATSASPLEQPQSVSTTSMTADIHTDSLARVDPGRLCGQLDVDGQAVTAVTPAAPKNPLSGERPLPFYAGTTLTVVFCDAVGEPVRTGAWSLAEHDGYSIAGTGDETYTIELTPYDGSIAFAEVVEQRDPETGFTIGVTVGAVAESQLIDGQVAFDSESAVDSYEDSETEFLDAVTAVEENASAVNESATRIRNQGLPAAEPNATLQPLNEAQSNLATTADEHTKLVYPAAFSGPTSTDLLVAIDTQRREANASAATALRTYQQAVTARTTQHRRDIQGSIGLGVLPGVMIGALVGVLIPYRRKRKVDYDRKFTKSAGGSRVFLVPAILGVVALVVGLALLWVTVPLGLVIA